MSGARTVAVITGTRAEFGLLRPVMRAIEAHPSLRLRVVAAGAHFLPPARTIREVEAEFTVAARVRMQRAGETGRAADAAATGSGIEGFARAFARLRPDWVVVLGDRIEAFAAASAASIGGIAVAHIHGGDRAEGIADEAMRHAITKLSHLHCAATKQSAERIRKMGERSERVHVTGSPAIDGLRSIKPLSRRELGPWHDVGTVLLLHPSGLPATDEARWADTLICAIDEAAPGDVLALAPNYDAGREAILNRLKLRVNTPNSRKRTRLMADGSASMRISARDSQENAANIGNRRWFLCDHLPRDRFIGLLKALMQTEYGLLVGNSSAGLIEAAALGVNVLNVGSRQAGRERTGRLIDAPEPSLASVVRGINELMGQAELRNSRLLPRSLPATIYGDGRAGPRIASLLADPKLDPRSSELLRKCNTY